MKASSSLLLLLITVIVVCFFAAQVATLIKLKSTSIVDLEGDDKSIASFLKASNNDNGHNNDGTNCNTTATTAKSATSKKAIASSDRTPLIPHHKPEGHFNGNPIHYRPYAPGWHSSVHCIGDNFGPDAWKYRSCQFSNFCFDTSTQSFVLFTSPEQHNLENAMNDAQLTEFTTAFSMNTTVSIGGINNKWGNDVYRMEWFPELRPVEEMQSSGGYYAFMNDATLLPFHSLAGFNPGHLVWDDFLPIFNILTMFQLLEKDLVLMRYKPEHWQWASCDRRWNNSKKKPYCKTMLKKFLPLIGQSLERMTTQENANVTWAVGNSDTNRSKYVCAENGAAGLGMLTDHGPKLHGWNKKDYDMTQNFGRGGMLYEFRNWMVSNIDIDPDKGISKAPYTIVFNVHSSTTLTRNVSFEKHMKRLRERLGKKYELDIRAETMSKMSLDDQIELVSGASIMVTMCGGGAVTGMFLPKGASLLTFFNEKERGGNTTPRLDWDLLNNLSYLRVHWLPRPEAKPGHDAPHEADYEAFVRLIDHELDIISHTTTE